MTAVMWLFLCQFQEVLFMDQTFMKERKIIPLVLSMSLPMVYLSSGQRYHSGNPASCRLQLWCERIPACKEYFYDRPHNGFRDHASRADSQLECSCSTHRNLYRKSSNDHDRCARNAHNQPRFHRVCSFRHLLWRA